MQEEHGEQVKPLEENEPDTLSEMERSEASLIPEEEESKDPDIFKKEIEKEVSQNDKSMTGDRTMYCTICNKQIEKYGRRKEDFKKSGWVFCPKHGWIKEGIHDKEMVSEQSVRFSIEEVIEKHGEQEQTLEGKESEPLPESTIPEESSMLEKELKDNMNKASDKTKYCTICNKKVDKYGRRKDDFSKPGWVFCPKHGWIKEGIHDKEIVSEQSLRFSIEEVIEKHGEQEKSLDRKESEILRESEKPEISPIQEEEQLETDLFIEKEIKTADLPIGERNLVRNNSTSIGIIISAIFVTVLGSLIVGYFVWKSSSNKILEIKSLRTIVQNERLTKQVQSQASPPPQESVLAEKSPEDVKSQTSTPLQEAVPQSEKPETTEKAKIKPSLSQSLSQTIFTVQVGAFTDFSYAKSLKKRLDKKGYHTYITSSKSKKEGRLYKVWTGKFSNRETAETLSVKITKTEGLQTFVTTWKKQYGKISKIYSEERAFLSPFSKVRYLEELSI